MAERSMSMSDTTWRRHANPWSVYTRFTCLPLITLAVWSRVWFGWWSLVPLFISIFWTWLNPRIFSEPKTLNSWASKGVMGERVFLKHRFDKIASHHIHMAHILTFLSALGGIVLIYGLYVLDFWAVMCGLILTILPKVWFVDRMVWIYEDYHRLNQNSIK